MQIITYCLSVIWSCLVRISTPFLLFKRLKNNLEEQARYKERYGKSLLHRPIGDLIWLHGASVGESLSLLPIIEKIRLAHPTAHFLITTTTVSSAKILGERLPNNCLHQYIPFDAKKYVNSFLNYWKPQAAILVESELWPNIILGLKKLAIPTFLLNARLSTNSFKNWQRFSYIARSLLNSFKCIYTQSDEFTKRYQLLGIKNVSTLGNIKVISKSLPCDQLEFDFWKKFINNRPCWVAASTHAGEEEIIIRTHEILKAQIPNLITIIAPRHIERCERLFEQFYNLSISTFSDPVETDEIILVDQYSKLGIFYRLCGLAFIGNSMITKGGGHNPLEPAMLNCLPVWGKNFQNFDDMQDFFTDIPCQQTDEAMLAETVFKYLNNPEICKKYTDIINERIITQQKAIAEILQQISNSLIIDEKINGLKVKLSTQ